MATAGKTKDAWSTDRIYKGLAARFAPPAYALLTEVPDATGFGKSRTADAIIMSVWPSRGLTLSGVEVKASRSDWVKERDDPSKAEAIAKYCDYWYLAVGDSSIVHPGELPDSWGLLIPNGESLKVAKEPAKLSPIPIDREFLASLLRVAATGPQRAIAREFERGRSIGHKEGAASTERERERLRKAAEDARSEHERVVREFEERSGLSINRWDAGRIGDAVKAYLRAGGMQEIERAVKEVDRIAFSLTRWAEESKIAIEAARNQEAPR